MTRRRDKCIARLGPITLIPLKNVPIRKALQIGALRLF